MKTDVYPSVLDVDAFGFQTNGVEVDGVDFFSCGKGDDVQPVVAGVVAVGQVGVAVFDFAALCNADAVDGDGAYDVGVGKMHFGDSGSG